jgi:hypothetical protein
MTFRGRLRKFGLELHPEKTRPIEFGRAAVHGSWLNQAELEAGLFSTRSKFFGHKPAPGTIEPTGIAW